MNKQEIEKAIKTLEELKSKGYEKFEVVRNPCYSYIEIEPILFALNQQLTNGWIPVTERLPERSRNHNVYVTLRYRETGHVFSDKMLWRYGRFMWFNGKEISDKYEIIAWKFEYMPESYKEVSE